MKKKVITIIFVCALSIVLSACGKTEKVQLGDYLNTEITAVGFEEHAKVMTEEVFDREALQLDLEDRIFNSSANNLNDALVMDEHIAEALNSTKLVYTVNGKQVKHLNNLSNGDSVKIKVTADGYTIEDLDIQLADGEYSFEVSGLEKGKEFDYFGKCIEKIELSGGNGTGEIDLVMKQGVNKPVSISVYAINNNGKFKNGDVAKIETNYDFEELTATGYYLKEEIMKYKIEGLSDIITPTSGISQEMKEDLKEHALDSMNSNSPDNINMDDKKAGAKVTYYKMYVTSLYTALSHYENVIFVLGRYPDTNGSTKYCFCCYFDPQTTSKGEYVAKYDEDELSELYKAVSNTIGGYTNAEIENIKSLCRSIGYDPKESVVEL